MLDDLVAIIETLQHRIATHRADLQANETRTRMALIDPLLTALGWDTSDPALVTPEYRVDAGWADYALRSGGENPAAVVEAKRLGSFVENHLDQAVGYCITQGIPYAAVTDGNNWQLYRTFEPVPLAEKRVLDVSVNGAAAHECALQFLLLWRSNLSTGHPVEPNRPVVGTSSSSPPQPPSKPPPSTEDGWVGLSEFTPVSGTKPPSNMGFPDGSKSPITLWRQLEQHTVVWLWQNKLLNSRQRPSGRKQPALYCEYRASTPEGELFYHHYFCPRNASILGRKRQCHNLNNQCEKTSPALRR